MKKENINMTVWFLIGVVVVVVLIFITVNKKDNTQMVEQNIATAKAGDTVSMNYTGRLADGTIFDSNVDPKFGHVEPFVFTLGAGRVIAGWDEGIVGMKVGDKKTLVVPPEKAYGPNAYGPIPGNSTLTFEVELLLINK